MKLIVAAAAQAQTMPSDLNSQALVIWVSIGLELDAPRQWRGRFFWAKIRSVEVIEVEAHCVKALPARGSQELGPQPVERRVLGHVRRKHVVKGDDAVLLANGRLDDDAAAQA